MTWVITLAGATHAQILPPPITGISLDIDGAPALNTLQEYAGRGNGFPLQQESSIELGLNRKARAFTDENVNSFLECKVVVTHAGSRGM